MFVRFKPPFHAGLDSVQDHMPEFSHSNTLDCRQSRAAIFVEMTFNQIFKVSYRYETDHTLLPAVILARNIRVSVHVAVPMDYGRNLRG
ncbi:MAG: hypothetical protein AAFY56_22245 [Pseudomonadota bacterium]